LWVLQGSLRQEGKKREVIKAGEISNNVALLAGFKPKMKIVQVPLSAGDLVDIDT